VEEAKLRHPQRIDEMARQLGMTRPRPDQVVWADAAAPANPTDVLAQNLSRFAAEGR
jgi:hypothetical protein